MSVEPTTSSVTKFYFLPTKKITQDGAEITQEEYFAFSKHKEKIKETQSYSFEYGYPFADFANINLYDTPGFANEKNKNDEKVTLSLLQKADVILYVVDVNAGTIKADELKRLQTLKEKQIYCILNKADNSTSQNIQKVKDELQSQNIFDKIISYSSIKVLQEAKNNLLKNIIEDIQQNKIPNKEQFSIVIKGEVEKGRRVAKYKVNIRDIVNEKGKKDIDISYIEAFRQKKSILKLLQNIANEQFEIVEKSILKDKKILTYRTKNYLKELLFYLETRTIPTVSLSENFEDDIEYVYSSLENLEDRLLNEGIEQEYKRIFKKCMVEEKVSKGEKSYLLEPYYKIVFRKGKVRSDIQNSQKLIEYVDAFYQQLEKVNKELKRVYDFELDEIEDLDSVFEEQRAEVLGYWYTSTENEDTNNNDYYYDKEKAYNKIKEIRKEIDDEPAVIYTYLTDQLKEENENKIHQKIGELKAQKTESGAKELQNKIKTYTEGL